MLSKPVFSVYLTCLADVVHSHDHHLHSNRHSRLKHGVGATNYDTRDKKVKQGLQNGATLPRLWSVAAKKLSLRPPYQPLRIPNNVRQITQKWRTRLEMIHVPLLVSHANACGKVCYSRLRREEVGGCRCECLGIWLACGNKPAAPSQQTSPKVEQNHKVMSGNGVRESQKLKPKAGHGFCGWLGLSPSRMAFFLSWASARVWYDHSLQ
jgi:hypothetical protein